MNPAEYNMLWMGQFPADPRMVLDENSMLSVGMSVLDEMPHQHHSMDMNTMLMPLSDYTANTATGQIAITPENIISSHHQLDPQQQTMLDQYNNMLHDQHASDDIIIQEDDDDDQAQQLQHQQLQMQIHQLQQQQQQQQQHHQHQLQQQHIQQHHQHHQQQLQQHQQQQQHQLLGPDDDDNEYEHHQLIDEDDGSGLIIEQTIDEHDDGMQSNDCMSSMDGGSVYITDGMDTIVGDDGSLIKIEDYRVGQQLLDSGAGGGHHNANNSFMTNVTMVASSSAAAAATSTVLGSNAANAMGMQTPMPMATKAATARKPSGSRKLVHIEPKSLNHTNQPATPTNKKIKPVKRPGLVLKTPIAYQPCLDPSVIPIQRDGMAVCERCGAIGVKHSFYTKERRFCSMACARNEFERLSHAHINSQQATTTTNMNSTNGPTTGAAQQQQQQQHHSVNDQHAKTNYRFKLAPQQQPANHPNDNNTDNNDNSSSSSSIMYKDILPQDELPQIARLSSPCPQEEKILTVRRKPSEFYNSYDWHAQLNASGGFYAADVTSFAHAPGYDMWRNIGVGLKVEVENTDCDTAHAPSAGGVGHAPTPHSFWVATVLRICGYKALLRYEGFGDEAGRDFWVNLCSSEVHPVGWCATRGKPLIPPRSIANRYADWKEFLVRHLSGARTLPSTFYNKIRDSFRSRFRTGLQLEVVDKNHISQVKLATVQKIVGKRLYVRYFDAPPDDNGFWCHEDSSLIHPVGWASTVGHNLAAPMEYLERMAGGPDQMIEACEDDSIIDLFRMNFTFEEYYVEDRPAGFEEGMKLEAVDPLNLSSICVATVMAVLKFGYMMIRIDSYEPDATGSDWFCYHERSPCIFPPGFCAENDIVLTPPRGYETTTFRWNQYLINTSSRPADPALFRRDMPATGFQAGMKLECADLMDPRLVCVATVAKVVGRLLKVHFDGWEDEYDQWLDCESPDMYPVGWCVLVGHKLEGPRVLPKQPSVTSATAAAGGGAANAAGGTAKQRKRKKKAKPADVNDKPAANTTNSTTIGQKTTKPKDNATTTEQQQRHQHELKQVMGTGRSTAMVKQELKHEMMDDDATHVSGRSGGGGGGSVGSHESSTNDMAATSVVGDYDDDGYSYSTTSGHSTPLPIHPDPSLTANSIRNPSVLLDQQQLLNVRAVAVAQQQQQPQPTPQPQQQQQKPTPIEQAAVVVAATASVIPRLSEASDASLAALQPSDWTTGEVTQFLRANDCAVHADAFERKQIDGRQLLQLTKDEIITMLDKKVGPSLKIFDLIQQLKSKLNPQQARLQKAAAAVAAANQKKNAYMA